MKIILLVLNSRVQNALEALEERFPQASIEEITRAEFEGGSLPQRFATLRARRPDIFIVATERLEWQRGQNLFMLFGALAGASQSGILDAYGALRLESRARLLLRAFPRIVGEAMSSAATLTRARRELRQLETEIEKRAALSAGPDSILPKHTRVADPQHRIIYLRATPAPGTQGGGASSHIKGVIEGLLELGAHVHLISNDTIAGIAETKIPLTIIGPEPQGTTRPVFDIHNNQVLTRGAVDLIEEDPPDFIYQRYARFSWAGVVATLRTNRPLFLEYNGSEVWLGRHWDRVGKLDLLARYERLNLAAAARIFVVSNVERNNLEVAGVPPEKIVVNPNGVDIDVFRPGVGGDRMRVELSIQDGEVLVGFVGTFGPWHGVLELAEAIKLIPAELPLRFVLIGAGALQGEMSRRLGTEVKAGRVIFTGAVEHGRVPAFLDACDILVSPHVPLAEGADFFGSPTKLFEYMGMGKGIVASRLGQIGDLLDHEQTALLVEPGNVRELADAIMRLAGSRELRERLGSAARKAVALHYTWKHNAERVLTAYESWLNGN
ncbi:MAG: glycosyltransferase family 4 protein [Blastocatellia bacterium]|nr:glycosyltransferase family 4 protein [Blastocatellia bacterium]